MKLSRHYVSEVAHIKVRPIAGLRGWLRKQPNMCALKHFFWQKGFRWVRPMDGLTKLSGWRKPSINNLITVADLQPQTLGLHPKMFHRISMEVWGSTLSKVLSYTNYDILKAGFITSFFILLLVFISCSLFRNWR